MTKITRLPVLIASAALLSIAGFAATSYAHPKKNEDKSQAQTTMSHDNHKDMKTDKKAMPKMDMSKTSAECQTASGKMNDHDMSKMKDHDMKNMEGHNMEKMKNQKETREKCTAEMKQATPHKH